MWPSVGLARPEAPRSGRYPTKKDRGRQERVIEPKRPPRDHADERRPRLVRPEWSKGPGGLAGRLYLAADQLGGGDAV